MPTSKDTDARLAEELRLKRKFRERMERCFGTYTDFDHLRRNVCWEDAQICHITIEKIIDTVEVLTESVMGMLEAEDLRNE